MHSTKSTYVHSKTERDDFAEFAFMSQHVLVMEGIDLIIFAILFLCYTLIKIVTHLA